MDTDVLKAEDLKIEKPCGCKTKAEPARHGPRRKKRTRGECPGCLKTDYCRSCVDATDRATRRAGG